MILQVNDKNRYTAPVLCSFYFKTNCC